MSAAASSSKTGYLSHELYFWHDSGLETYEPSFEPRGSQESPESKRRFHSLVQVTSLADTLIAVKPREASDEEILRFHTEEYLKRVKDVSDGPIGGRIGHELHISHGGYRIANLSLGGVLAAVEAAFAGTISNAYCLVRPPGHHADRDGGHGFCVFSNVSLAAAHAIAKLGAKRVAVVDWDVHHGNGTEQHFWGSDQVLFVSLHQDKLYPLNTGGVESVGEGAGRGFNLNIPLPPGSGFGAYEYAFQQVVLPALHAHRPDIILVSSGFDCSFLDPLGRMMLTSDCFRSMTRMLKGAAEELCGGKLVMAHEGGSARASAARARCERTSPRAVKTWGCQRGDDACWASWSESCTSYVTTPPVVSYAPLQAATARCTCPTAASRCWRSCLATRQA